MALSDKELDDIVKEMREKRDKLRPKEDILIEARAKRRLRDAAFSFFGGLADTLDLPGQGVAGTTNFLLDNIRVPKSLSLSGDGKSFFSEDPLETVQPFKDLSVPSGGFRMAFENIGMSIPDDEIPRSPLNFTFRFMGESLPFSMMAPFGSGIKLVETQGMGFFTKAKEAIKTGLKQAGQTARQTPLKFLATEQLESGGAGLGVFFAQEAFPDSATAQFFGGVSGGLATKFRPIKLLVKGGRITKGFFVRKFGESGSFRRAKDRIARDVIDVDQAVKNIDNPQLSEEIIELASPAQLTQDNLLLEVEKAVIDAGDTVSDVATKDKSVFRHGQRIAKMNQVITDALEADPSDFTPTKKALQQQAMYHKELIETRMSVAALEADRKLSKLTPGSTKEQANLVVKETLIKAEKNIRDSEDQIWSLVPMDEIVLDAEVSPVFRTWEKILRNRTEELSPNDLLLTGKNANDLTKFLGKLVKRKTQDQVSLLLGLPPGHERIIFKRGLWAKRQLTLRNVQNLRSRILEEIRITRASHGSSRKISLLNDLQESLLSAMGAKEIDNTTESGAALVTALDFSREANQTLKAPHVSKIFGVDKFGGERIPDTLILENTFSGGGAQSTAKFQELINVIELDDSAPNPEGLREAASDWIMNQFRTESVRNDFVNPTRAENFLRKNEALLNQFPRIKDNILDAIRLQKWSKLIQEKGQQVISKFNDPNISKAAMFLKRGPSKLFDELSNTETLDAPGLEKELAKIGRALSADSTGEAHDGFRKAFLHWMREKATTAPSASSPTEVSVFGQNFISGVKFQRLMKNPNVQKIMEEVLTNEQQKRMQLILNDVKLLDKIRFASASSEGVAGDTLGKTRTLLARVFGARTGTTVAQATGTGGIQMQAIFSQTAVDRLRDIVRDPAADLVIKAITSEDPNLLRALLTEVVDEESLNFVRRQLNGWLINTIFEAGGTYLSDKGDTEVSQLMIDVSKQSLGEIDISNEIGLPQ